MPFPQSLLITLLPATLLLTLPCLIRMRNDDKGLRVRAHLEGLRLFIRRVDADRLRRVLEADPTYRDRLLPYAVLFGMGNHWLELYAEDPLGLTRAIRHFPEWIENERWNFWRMEP